MILSQLAEDRPLNVPDLYGAVNRYAGDRRDAVREKAGAGRARPASTGRQEKRDNFDWA
jgi:hypothetical protein